jgi:hypothetical protein
MGASFTAARSSAMNYLAKSTQIEDFGRGSKQGAHSKFLQRMSMLRMLL